MKITAALRRSGLLLLGLILGALAAEALIRVLGAAPQVVATAHQRYRLSSEPAIIYEPVPGFVFGSDSSNVLGFRGPVCAVERTPAVARIVVVGDSISEGLLIRDYDDVYPAVVEADLCASGRPVEVLNLGVNGYNTVQEVATLEHRGLAFAPDLVLLQFSHNDLHNDDGNIGSEILLKAMQGPGVEAAWADRRLLGSALYRFVKFRALRWALEPKLRKSWRGRMAEGVERIDRALGDLVALREQHGFELLLVVFPRFDGPFEPYQWSRTHEVMAELTARHEIDTVDLHAAFQEEFEKSGRPLWLDHVHPNVGGQHCAGREIARTIADLRLLDAPESGSILR